MIKPFYKPNSWPQVPNLFPKDELLGIMEALTPKAKKLGKQLTAPVLYAFFVEQCRMNLHMVIAMSPVGSAFRERLRMFPSLVNCCTIDWFSGGVLCSQSTLLTQKLNPINASKYQNHAVLWSTLLRWYLASFFTSCICSSNES